MNVCACEVVRIDDDDILNAEVSPLKDHRRPHAPHAIERGSVEEVHTIILQLLPNNRIIIILLIIIKNNNIY